MKKKEIQAEALTAMINTLAKADNDEKLAIVLEDTIWKEHRRQPTPRERTWFETEVNDHYIKMVDRRTKLRS